MLENRFIRIPDSNPDPNPNMKKFPEPTDPDPKHRLYGTISMAKCGDVNHLISH
jgi:hypothetical protein